ncbi:helix-turn-helix transcriptional regulator [Arundinibacter roseus]|uniref:AraC family transcriptional regulator n=1 Tax=Arundinibacter roseus TaxID=2070510 RepID=A0A4R4KEE3_9BACT|nr:AraC family transcriptional regulator [Arundinibacter roseus]TDB65182.1 AraC family transcriptional regulator [Arundinibacter roseus]
MKPISFHIPRTQREVFRIQAERLPHFYDRLHLHDEIQFTLIVNGAGTLIAGDFVGRFEPGDVFMIGKQLPHVFRCDRRFYESPEEVESISVFFDESYAGTDFWETAELQLTREWLQRLGQGGRLTEPSRTQAASYLQNLANLQGLDKLIEGFRLLKYMEESTDSEPLSVQEGGQFSKELLGDRMNKIVSFTFHESHRAISIEEVADLVALTPSAFCRFFKLRTRKTYFTFLNEIRISHACRLLLTTDWPVGTICMESGFSNLSHFNVSFRKSTGVTPKAYRMKVR